MCVCVCEGDRDRDIKRFLVSYVFLSCLFFKRKRERMDVKLGGLGSGEDLEELEKRVMCNKSNI